MHDVGGYKFTDLNNSLGAIYIVSDPRNVLRSYANHMQFSEEEASNALISYRSLVADQKGSKASSKTITLLGNWGSHYQTWKSFKKVNKYILIKYEDLVKETEKNFQIPKNYFPNDNPKLNPINRWRSHAHLLYGNWINEIYQTTPFEIEKIGLK